MTPSKLGTRASRMQNSFSGETTTLIVIVHQCLSNQRHLSIERINFQGNRVQGITLRKRANPNLSQFRD